MSSQRHVRHPRFRLSQPVQQANAISKQSVARSWWAQGAGTTNRLTDTCHSAPWLLRSWTGKWFSDFAETSEQYGAHEF